MQYLVSFFFFNQLAEKHEEERASCFNYVLFVALL